MKNRYIPYFQRKVKPMENPTLPTNGKIIVPVHYDHEITIMFDSTTGKSELRSKNPMNTMVMCGLLAQFVSNMMNQMIQNAKPNSPIVKG